MIWVYGLIITLYCRLSYGSIFLYVYDPKLPSPSTINQFTNEMNYSFPISFPISYTSNNKTPFSKGNLPFDYKNFFIAEWSGVFEVLQSGSYNITSGADDGWVLKIDGNTVFTDWDTYLFRSSMRTRTLTKGNHTFSLLTYQYTGNVSVYLNITPPCTLLGNVTVNYKTYDYILGKKAAILEKTEVHSTYDSTVIYGGSLLTYWIATLYPIHDVGTKWYEIVMESSVGTLAINYNVLINNDVGKFASNSTGLYLVADQPYIFELYFVTNYPSPVLKWRSDPSLPFSEIPPPAFPDTTIYNGTLNTDNLVVDSSLIVLGDLITDVLVISSTSNLTVTGNLRIDEELHINPTYTPLINSKCISGTGTIIFDSLPPEGNTTVIAFSNCTILPNMSIIFPELNDSCNDVDYSLTKHSLQVAFHYTCGFSLSLTLPVVLSVLGLVILAIVVISVVKEKQLRKELNRLRGRLSARSIDSSYNEQK